MKTRSLSLSCLGLALLLSGGCDEDEPTPPADAATSDAAGGGSTGSDAAKTDVAVATDAGASDAPAVDAAASDAAATDSGDAGATLGTKIASSAGAWTVYATPYTNSDADNPITSGITGTAEAFDVGGGKTLIKLEVAGLPPSRGFGSHVHKLSCDNMKAGGHYQHMPFPPDGSASDPAFANPMNEVWLDFTTDATGKGSSSATVDWRPRAGEASAVMIHDMKTGDGGIAGAKLACIDLKF